MISWEDNLACILDKCLCNIFREGKSEQNRVRKKLSNFYRLCDLVSSCKPTLTLYDLKMNFSLGYAGNSKAIITVFFVLSLRYSESDIVCCFVAESPTITFTFKASIVKNTSDGNSLCSFFMVIFPASVPLCKKLNQTKSIWKPNSNLTVCLYR